MTDNTTNKHTTADGLARAHAALQGDWDSAGVTIGSTSRARSQRRSSPNCGWARDRWRGGPGPWRSPSGERIWHTDEAVALAVTAEPLAETPTAERPPSDEQRLRDLVTAVLEHDTPQGDTDEIVIERTASGRSVVVAASDRRLVIASLAGAPTQLWHRLADRVIDALGVGPENSNHSSKRPDGR